MRKKILVNGKFLSVPNKTGVHRVAEEFILALENILKDKSDVDFEFEIVVPKNFISKLKLEHIKVTKKGIISGFFKNIPWEHFNLPIIANGSYLVSLCNVAPLLYKKSLVVIHDAQVYSTPKSYSLAFRLWYKCLIPIIARRCKTIITVSNFSKSQLISHGIADSKKIIVIPNGCDHMLRITSDNSILSKHNLSDKVYFIAQSNLQDHKNIAVLLSAFNDIKLKSYSLVLYGNKKRSDFENLGFYVPENVVFTGRVSDQELKALIEKSAATLTPSLTEGFGLQPLEGMVLGVPAIISPCGALPEVCGEVAYIADPNSPNEWVRAILDTAKLVDDFALKEQVKSHASNFTWNKSAEKLISYLNEI